MLKTFMFIFMFQTKKSFQEYLKAFLDFNDPWKKKTFFI